jgi:hypothetical protein
VNVPSVDLFCLSTFFVDLFCLYALQATSKQATWSDFLVQTVAGILLGGVLVVAFVRKKDAQPFISIEDFYGGFFVGFSAGYIGKALLNKVLPIP